MNTQHAQQQQQQSSNNKSDGIFSALWEKSIKTHASKTRPERLLLCHLASLRIASLLE